MGTLANSKDPDEIPHNAWVKVQNFQNPELSKS